MHRGCIAISGRYAITCPTRLRDAANFWSISLPFLHINAQGQSPSPSLQASHADLRSPPQPSAMSLFTSMALRQSPFVASLARSYASASKKIAFQKPQANAISRIRTKQPTAKSAAAAKKSAAAAETPAAAKVGPTPHTQTCRPR